MSDRREIVVRVASLAVAGPDSVLVTWGLGSCVALMLADPAAGVAGMAHILLPSPSLSRDALNPAKFPQTAVPGLVAALRRLGGDPHRIVAKLAGGATMFAPLLPPGTVHMGERNVLACRTALREAEIPIVAEDVGGEKGRSVWLDAATGRAVVRSLGRDDVVL